MGENDQVTFINRLRKKVTYVMMLEMGVLVAMVVIAFSVATYHFLKESVQTLVPFSSLSNCDTYSEVYNLVPQSIYQEFPATVIATDYTTGKTANGYSDAIFVANWSSCLQTSVDGNLHLEEMSNVYYEPIGFFVGLNDVGSFSFSYNGSSSTNNGCFRLQCGFNFTFHSTPNPRKNYDSLLNDSIFINVPYNYNDVIDFENNTGLVFANNQLITSISGTNESVTASCSVSLTGYYLEVMSVSNSIAGTGTYLCTQYTSTFQAVSSGLSIALATLGFCRMYFTVKSAFAK